MLRKFLSLCLALVLAVNTTLVVAAAPGNAPDPVYFVDEAKLPFGAPASGLATTRYWGLRHGAGYRIEVPANWNGKLVLYAHGYRGTGPELTVDNPPLREYFVAQGFAWAASSYSKNGYDVKEGVKDTHSLGQYFTSLVGKPSRTYIHGFSMGGHITGVAIEQYPGAYDGAMPVCGVMGDNELFDFFLDFSLVSQSLAGIQATFPPPTNYQTSIVPRINAALGPITPGNLSPAATKLRAMVEQRTGGTRPFFNLSFSVWYDFLHTLGGTDGTLNGKLNGNVAGNTNTIYQLDANPALSPDEQALNDAVLRVAPDPQARNRNGLSNVPPINGNLPIPVLSMHTIGDLFVPFSMEQIYARRVAAQGASGQLVTRAIRDVRHCGFSGPELVEGFSALVNWVENGVRPAGDEILNPQVVAAPVFGCAFTRGNRLYAPCA